MRISITIMAHPKRRKEAERLLVELTKYPFIQAYITWDTDNSEWSTGVKALQRGIGLADWHLVIQDDAILTPDLYDNVIGAINAVPTKTVISLYTGQVRPMAERVGLAVDGAVDGTFLEFNMLLWGVGVLLPSDHIEPMLDFVCEKQYDDTDYDNRIGMFYQRNRLPIYYTIPSLVDHDDDMGSLLAHGNTDKPRVAHRPAIGRVDWTSRVVGI